MAHDLWGPCSRSFIRTQKTLPYCSELNIHIGLSPFYCLFTFFSSTIYMENKDIVELCYK